MIGKLETYAIGALIVLVAATGAYFWAKHEGVMEERGRWEAKQAAATRADLVELQNAVEKSNTIASETKAAIEKSKGRTIVERGVIERETKTDVRYLNVCLPDAGLVHWNNISAGRAIVPNQPTGQQPDATMPEGVRAPSAERAGTNAAAKPPGR